MYKQFSTKVHLNKKLLFKEIKFLHIHRNYFSENIKLDTNNSNNITKYKPIIDGFNKDWKKISQEKELYRINRVKEELLPSQRRFIELLANKIVNMTNYQISDVFKSYNERCNKLKNIVPLSISEPWMDLQNQLDNKMPEEGYKFSNHEELMKQLSKWYQSQNPNFGMGAASASPAAEIKEKIVEKKEEKKEKEAYDIELTSYDPAKKIVIIKDVRAILNLGLKEAKELVEKAPTVIMRGIKKAETEELIKKFKDNGAVLTLK